MVLHPVSSAVVGSGDRPTGPLMVKAKKDDDWAGIMCYALVYRSIDSANLKLYMVEQL